MNENRFIVQSQQSLERFIKLMPEIFQRGKYIIVSWEFGAPATTKQKALLKIWIRKVAGHLLKKPEKSVTKDEMERMTRSIKKRYYTDTHEAFMIKTEGKPFHPDKEALEVTSSADWTQAECTRVMEWLQATASLEYDLILESTGEHKQIKRDHNI